jgi:hypothetical protein
MISFTLILTLTISAMYSVRASSIHEDGKVRRFAHPHRKALALTNWDQSRLMEDAIQLSSVYDLANPSVSKVVGSTTPTNENKDDEQDKDGEWENSITSATPSKTLSASPTQTTTRISTVLPTTMLDPNTVSPTQTASVGTSTRLPTQVVLETSAPITMNPTISPIANFDTTTETTTPATEYPSIHMVWTYAPGTQFQTHPPTFATILTSAPATYSPTYYPTYAPTHAPILQSSEPTTLKPTPFSSQEHVTLVRKSASCHRFYGTSLCFL